jgi:hypothetical protein
MCDGMPTQRRRRMTATALLRWGQPPRPPRPPIMPGGHRQRGATSACLSLFERRQWWAIDDTVDADDRQHVVLLRSGRCGVRCCVRRLAEDACLYLDLQTGMPPLEGDEVAGAMATLGSKDVVAALHQVNAHHQFADAADRAGWQRLWWDDVVGRPGPRALVYAATTSATEARPVRVLAKLSTADWAIDPLANGRDRLAGHFNLIRWSATPPDVCASRGHLVARIIASR